MYLSSLVAGKETIPRLHDRDQNATGTITFATSRHHSECIIFNIYHLVDSIIHSTRRLFVLILHYCDKRNLFFHYSQPLEARYSRAYQAHRFLLRNEFWVRTVAPSRRRGLSDSIFGWELGKAIRRRVALGSDRIVLPTGWVLLLPNTFAKSWRNHLFSIIEGGEKNGFHFRRSSFSHRSSLILGLSSSSWRPGPLHNLFKWASGYFFWCIWWLLFWHILSYLWPWSHKLHSR